MEVTNWKRGRVIVVRDEGGHPVGRTCAECGKIMSDDDYPPRVEFCSRECYAAYDVRRLDYGWPKPRWVYDHFTYCAHCGLGGYFKKFCSKECSNAGRKFTRNCPVCGKRIEGRGIRFCSSRCYGISKRKVV